MIRNITLSAEEKLIAQARSRAAKENRSLNDAFREWLEQWTNHIDPVTRYQELMQRADQFNPGKKFDRDVLNGR